MVHILKSKMARQLLIIFFCACNVPTSGAKQATSVVAAPGSDVTLNCFFPRSGTGNPFSMIVSWMYEDSKLVHRYNHGRDMLEEQSPAYRGRTMLYPDQIAVGNLSLRLMEVQPCDQGSYTCAMDDEHTRYHMHISLLVAAPYVEPTLEFIATCDSITVRFTSSEGFPKPTVQWVGVNEKETTVMRLDSRGRYEVQSEMVLKPTEILTLEVEMTLAILNQKFSRPITVYPLPDCSAGFGP
ncbi:hypothetical protein GJAV_G00049050 [Gymnothorax javanicus]|nr:hypothetical protein GJAV_G00049050 [Gymnothorax javanicus]